MQRASSHTGHLASSTKLPFEKTCGGYLKKNSNMGVVGWLRVSVRHCVDHIVHADPKPECGEPFRILRIVGMLPRIAKVHIVAYGDHQASLVVVDAAPARFEAVVFIGEMGSEEQRAGNLIAVVQVEDGVENG